MGGDLGSRTAALLEDEPWVDAMLGMDTDPPRRRLHRSEFHLVRPSDHDRILDAVTECRALESIVVRSGVEVYGRARGSLTRPDESAPVAPTSQFGRNL